MGNRGTLAAVFTALASLGTLIFTVINFIMNSAQYSSSSFPRYASGTPAFFGWVEFVVLMFGWVSVVCMYMRKRYCLAITGAFLMWLSIPMEFFLH
jgi:hypothetical protein